MSMIFDDIPHTPRASATDRLMSMTFDDIPNPREHE
jgi:hypothetical protein